MHGCAGAAAAAAIGESLYTTPLVIVDSSNAAGIEIQPSESVEGRGGSTPTPVSEGRPHLMTSMRRSSTPPPNITILGSSERSSEDNQITTPVPRQRELHSFNASRLMLTLYQRMNDLPHSEPCQMMSAPCQLIYLEWLTQKLRLQVMIRPMVQFIASVNSLLNQLSMTEIP